jgi:hypothetical protein
VAITPDQAKEVGGNIWFNQENGLYRAGYVSAFPYSPLPMANAPLFFIIGFYYLALCFAYD